MPPSGCRRGVEVSRSLLLLLLVGALLLPCRGYAFSLADPEHTGAAVNLGYSYDPKPESGFVQLSLMALYDYEQIMPNPAPEPLRFKFEGSLGVADASRRRAIGSLNFFALYYLEALQTAKIHPYVEGGAGIIYTDYQVRGQGLRINFNPQAGIGSEFRLGDRLWYGALRAHHLSNSHLYRKNRGINSLMLQFGFYF